MNETKFIKEQCDNQQFKPNATFNFSRSKFYALTYGIYTADAIGLFHLDQKFL